MTTAISEARFKSLKSGDAHATMREAAAMIGVSYDTVFRWVKKNKIPRLKEGRVILFHMPTVLKAMFKE